MSPVPDDVRQILIIPEFWPHMLAWLGSRGLTVAKMPMPAGTDDLDTYCVMPKDWDKGKV